MPSTSDYKTKHDELQILINSRTPIITVETSEEDRLEKLLLAIATQMAVPFYTWSVTAGLKRFTGAPLYGTDDPEKALANIAWINGDAIFLLKDFARYCANDHISRRLRLTGTFCSARRSIVIAGASLDLPPELKCESVVFQLGLPSADELLTGVNQVLAEAGRNQRTPVALDAEDISRLARNLVGLTQDEALRTLRKCLLAHGTADAGLLETVLEASTPPCAPMDCSKSSGVMRPSPM